MATIRLLPTVLVNQIAAGEVVERPASAVKELENLRMHVNSSFFVLRSDVGYLLSRAGLSS